MRKLERKGAIELSVGTIVVLVIGMTMLIMGIILVRSIFSGAIANIDVINDGVRSQVNQLFADNEKKVVVNLPNGQVDVKKGEVFGIAFGIRNTLEGQSQASTFTHTVTAGEVQTGCTLTLEEANSYIKIGKQGSVSLLPGSTPESLLIRIQPSPTAPLCEILYNIDVSVNSQPYDRESFIVKIVGN